MVPEIKEKWLKALRSDEYEQGTTFLRSIDGSRFCCLGVLCDIIDSSLWREQYGTYLYDGALCILPETLRCGVKIDPNEQKTLTRMNDGGASFTEIADYIEETL